VIHTYGLEHVANPLLENESEDSSISGRLPSLIAASFSDESDVDGLVVLSSVSSEEVSPEEKLASLTQQWDHLVNSFNRLTGAFKRFRVMVADEIEAANERITSSDARVGYPGEVTDFEDCITAWDGILTTYGKVEDINKDYDETKASLVLEQGAVKTAVMEIKSKAATAFETVDKQIEEIATIVKALNDEQIALNAQVHINSSPVSEVAFRELQAEVGRLKYELGASSGLARDSIGGSKAEAEIAALKIQMNILASRIPLDSTMSLGGHMFKSKGDVQLFVEKKMASNLFHLCHDPITLLESLTGLHVEKKDVLNKMYQADRVGMNDAEARHCASFQLILPTVFGYVKEGASTRHNLPAVKSFKDWNPRDGTSGVKSYIATGLDDLKLQVRQEIEDSFPSDQTEAKSLARDMHDGSQTFLSELMAFSGDFFDELIHSSDSMEEEAWELLSALIKRVFEEFRKVRASAANAARDKNAVTRCLTYLWASIQAHRVMKDMLDARFRNHVSIAPVIILHVFKTRITKVAHTAALKRLEGRFAALEKPAGKRILEEKNDKKDTPGAAKK
jgi:hypothetical protein